MTPLCFRFSFFFFFFSFRWCLAGGILGDWPAVWNLPTISFRQWFFWSLWLGPWLLTLFITHPPLHPYLAGRKITGTRPPDFEKVFVFVMPLGWEVEEADQWCLGSGVGVGVGVVDAVVSFAPAVCVCARALLFWCCVAGCASLYPWPMGSQFDLFDQNVNVVKNR